MTVARLSAPVALLAMPLVLAACGEPTPSLSRPDLAAAAPRARAELELAFDAAEEAPGTAHRWNTLAMLLLDHEFDAKAAAASNLARELEPGSFYWPYAWGCRTAVNNPEAAVDHLAAAVELRPDHVGALLALARAHDRAGEAEAAAAELRRAIELDPFDPEARTALARLQLEAGDVAGAKRELTVALEHGPDSRIALNAMAEIARREGDRERAAELAARADEALPAHDLFDLPLMAARANAPGGQVVLARARVMSGNGRGAAGEALLRDYVSLNPANPFAHVALGQFLVDQGRMTEGLAALYAASGIAPDLLDAKLALADGQRLAGQLAAAVEAYRGILRDHPDARAARRGLAARLARTGRVDEAVEIFRALIAEEPDDVNTRFALALSEMGRGGFEAAAEALGPLLPEPGARIGPAELRAMSTVGLARLRLGETSAAADVLGRAVAADPSSLENRRGLAVALAAEGRAREAVALLREGLELHPDDPTLRFELAWLLATSPDDAVRDGGRAVTLAESLARGPGAGHPVTLDLLACAYAAAGRFPRAVETAEQALDLARRGAPPAMIAAMEVRLETFRRGEPWRDGGDAGPRAR